MRWPNLVIVAGVQILIYFTLIRNDASAMGVGEMLLLTLITILIAGGGYVINDYYDHEMDAINRPGQRVAGNEWTLKEVLQCYRYVVAIGGVLSTVLAVLLGLLPFLLLYPIAVLALWAYSRALKCLPVIGNIWVASFCAGVVLILPFPDWVSGHSEAVSPDILYYAAFAFLVTWLREIVKDIEDKDGDTALGCKTLVVRFGVLFGKLTATLPGLLLIWAIFLWTRMQAGTSVEIVLNVLQGLIITSMAFVWWAKDKTYFRVASLLIKAIMVLGTFVLLLL